MEREGKKARLEMKGKERILFIEVDGDLLGIDLNKYDYSNLQSESVPDLAPICCRVELRKHKYPHAMRHMKVNDDKLYLLGGECFDFDPYLKYPECYLGYSDKVYEFNLHTVTTQINDNHDDEPVVLHPESVLKPFSPLLRPMFASVANLRDRFYVFHDRVPTNNVFFHKPQDPRFTFEEFDPIQKNWFPAPIPLFYQTIMKPDFNEEDEDDEEEEHPAMEWPLGTFPVSCRFVVDDKWLFFSRLQRLVHIFTSGDNEWKADPDKYASISHSFGRICDQSVPNTGLWLSNFNFGFDDDSNLGVMISIQLVKQYDCYGIDIPYVYRYNALDFVFHYIYKVYAYAINKSTCHVEFYQPLDEVLSDMIRTPLNTESKVTQYLLDLGESEHNNNRSRRRICAILTGDDLLNRVPYLYISIFELQMTQATSLDPCSKFLHVITPIKKLIFRLDKDKDRLAKAYNNNTFLFNAYDTPPLNAFVV